MKRLFFILLIFGGQVSAHNLNSATASDTINKALFGIYGMVNTPSAQFADAGYRTGGGAGFEWYTKSFTLSKTKDFNSRIGLSMFYAGQGGVTNKVRLHDPVNAPGTQTLHNNLFGMDFRAKIIHDKNTVRPYVDLFAGLRNYSTSQTLTINQPVYGYEDKTRTTEISNIVLDYGAAFGFLIKLTDNVSFDIKASYSTGNSRVRFVDFNNMGYDGYMYNTNGHYAIPAMVSIQAGLVFKFRIESSPAGYSGGYGYSYNNNYNYSQPNYYYSPTPTETRQRSYSTPSYHYSGHSGGMKPLR